MNVGLQHTEAANRGIEVFRLAERYFFNSYIIYLLPYWELHQVNFHIDVTGRAKVVKVIHMLNYIDAKVKIEYSLFIPMSNYIDAKGQIQFFLM